MLITPEHTPSDDRFQIDLEDEHLQWKLKFLSVFIFKKKLK